MKNVIRATIILGTILSLTACGKTTTATAPKVEETAKTRVITDAKGEVEIPSDPQRVADLTGSSDTLSILGLPIVATANSDAYDYTVFPNYLAETLKDAAIVGYSMQDSMDVEAIMAAEPDLILISTVQEKMYDTLKEIAPTVMIEMEQIDWKVDMQALGKLFDREEKSVEWLSAYEEKAKKAGDEVKEKLGADTTYLSFLASGGQFYVFSKAGLGDVLSSDMGLALPVNMPQQADISLPVVNYEGLAQIDADYVVVVGTDADLAELEKNEIWNGMRSVKEGHVVTLPASPYFNQGYSTIGREQLIDEIKQAFLELN